MAPTTVVNLRAGKYDVYIGRPSKWGNPISLQSTNGNREECIRLYTEWLATQPQLIADAQKELKGKVLGCFCKPALCHGDVLARIANTEPTR